MIAKRIKDLIKQLNAASDAYYNTGNPIMTDYEFDKMYDELVRLEKESGIIYGNSPTQNVGAAVLDELLMKKHDHPMLSLDKCHSAEEVADFSKGRELVAMTKMDGLTVTIRYENGKLISAETRGNGEEGKDITEHVKQFDNVPLSIEYKDTLVIDGEAIITYEDFEKINASLPASVKKYDNPRNLAAGTLGLLETEKVKSRHMKFIAWDLITGPKCDYFVYKLDKMENLGFNIVPFALVPKKHMIDWAIQYIKEKSEKCNYPMDGLVFKFNYIPYGESLGRTDKFFRNGIAYKFDDEKFATELIDVEWTLGKTGTITPTAVFRPVRIEGSSVERASLHNVSIFKSLELSYGDTVTVFKANLIIPQIFDNLTRSGLDLIGIPEKCPSCGGKVKIIKENESEVLVCDNPGCKGKLLKRMSQFVSKEALNIKGLSEKTLELMINYGFIHSLKDIFNIHKEKEKLTSLPRMGVKSVNKIIEEIEVARTVTLRKFLVGLSIPGIGDKAAKVIEKYVVDAMQDSSEDDIFQYFIRTVQITSWSNIPDFGEVTSASLKKYFKENIKEVLELADELVFINPYLDQEPVGESLEGLTFVITGSVEHFKNRKELKEKIEFLGGKVTGSVTKKTDYLINNDAESGSSKNQSAKKMGVNIITEDEFIHMIGG